MPKYIEFNSTNKGILQLAKNLIHKIEINFTSLEVEYRPTKITLPYRVTWRDSFIILKLYYNKNII